MLDPLADLDNECRPPWIWPLKVRAKQGKVRQSKGEDAGSGPDGKCGRLSGAVRGAPGRRDIVNGDSYADFFAAFPLSAANSLAPSGLPSPVQGSHPAAALKEPLLPLVMS